MAEQVMVERRSFEGVLRSFLTAGALALVEAGRVSPQAVEEGWLADRSSMPEGVEGDVEELSRAGGASVQMDGFAHPGALLGSGLCVEDPGNPGYFSMPADVAEIVAQLHPAARGTYQEADR